MARERLMDDSGYMGFEECPYTDDCMCDTYIQALDDAIAKLEEERDAISNWDDDEYYNGLKAGYQYSIETVEELKKGSK